MVSDFIDDGEYEDAGENKEGMKKFIAQIERAELCIYV